MCLERKTPESLTLTSFLNRTEEPSPNLTIRDQPIHEDENAAQQAMSDVASRLRQVRISLTINIIIC